MESCHRTWCATWGWIACFWLPVALLLRPAAVVLVDATILALVAVLVDRLHASPEHPVRATARRAGRVALLGTAATACATVSWPLLGLLGMCAALTSPRVLAPVLLPTTHRARGPARGAVRQS